MVWKKQDPPAQPAQAAQTSEKPEAPKPPAAPPAPRGGARSLATIGPSIRIDGDLRGNEDLQVEGRVDGTIHVEQNVVTIGRSGRVQANIFAKAVRVEGTVQGDLFGSEEVVIHQSGKVEGNLTAPRVTLEDGSTFRGSIDMSAPDKAKAKASVESKDSGPSDSSREKAAG